MHYSICCIRSSGFGDCLLQHRIIGFGQWPHASEIYCTNNRDLHLCHLRLVISEALHPVPHTVVGSCDADTIHGQVVDASC